MTEEAGDGGTSSSASAPPSSELVDLLRTALRPQYPEIDSLYSDAYLASVIDVPGRTYEYARDEKIRGALEWRRAYRVDELRAAFRCCDDDDGESEEGSGGSGRFVLAKPTPRNKETEEEGKGGDASNGGVDGGKEQTFVPTRELIEACGTGAFFVVREGSDGEDGGGGGGAEGGGGGRVVLRARTSCFDWWKAGVDAGLQYHVLVIEHALEVISRRNKQHGSNYDGSSSGSGSGKKATAKTTTVPESMVLYVDTADASLVPPPMSALTGMVDLLQRAYPDRIHRIYVGPVSSWLMWLYDLVCPLLRPRSRDKIVLLGCSPTAEAVAAASAVS